MSEERLLSVQFEAGNWTHEQLNDLVEVLGEVVPDDVNVIAVPDDIEYLDGEQVRDILSDA